MTQENKTSYTQSPDSFPSSAKPIFIRFFLWLLMMGLIVLVVLATNKEEPVQKSVEGEEALDDSVTDPFSLNKSAPAPSSVLPVAPKP